MQIFIIVPTFSPNIGGVESYLNDLCTYLTKKAHKVYVMAYQPLTTRARGLSLEKTGDLEIHRLSWFGHNWFHKLEHYPLLEFLYLTPWLFINSLFFMIKNHKHVNAIHAQGLNAAFISMVLSKIFKKKNVVSTCAVYNFKKNSFFSRVAKWVFSSAGRVLALSDNSRRELLAIGVPEKLVQTYFLWINQEIYKPCDKIKAKEKIGLSGKFIVLFTGRFIKIKGVELLLEVAKESRDNIYFCFIGDNSPLLEVVEKASVDLKNVILVKDIRGVQLVPYYQAADMLAVPSLYDEAFGKVIIEALSCGTPVVGSNKGAIPDVLDSSVGRIVEPTIENFKKEIDLLYSRPDILENLTMMCRNYALERYSDKNAEIIEKSYGLEKNYEE